MRVVFFSSKPYDEAFFNRANAPHGFDFHFLKPHLDRRIRDGGDCENLVTSALLRSA